MNRTLVVQRALLRRRVVAMRAAAAGTERIALDGTIGFASMPAAAAAAPVPTTTTTRAPIVPADAAPLSDADVERLVAFVADHGPSPPLVLTGAGVSTEAGLPDYRGPGGAYSLGFKPMTHQAFLASEQNRRRYWSRAFVGWQGFSSAEPSAAHVALARLQRRGWVGEIITQNVDRLHTRAGAPNVLELHGSTHDVVCLECGATSPRAPLQAAMAALNPEAAASAGLASSSSSSRPRLPYVSAAEAAVRATPGLDEATPQQQQQRRPDGDAEVAADRSASFRVPPCPACGAGGHDRCTLKPDVVFFGDGVPRERADRALRLAESAKALLVVGSSLRVWSAFRLVKAAAENGAQIAVLNYGPTRADEQLPQGTISLRLDALAGEALMRVERHARLQLPAVSG